MFEDLLIGLTIGFLIIFIPIGITGIIIWKMSRKGEFIYRLKKEQKVGCE